MLFALLVLVAVAETVSASGGIHISGWTYAATGEWANSFPMCGGTKQSPINFDSNNMIYDPSLPAVVMHGYNKIAEQSTMEMKHNGHSVSIKLQDGLTLSGGGLPASYKTDSLHFHWGTDISKGSEHTVNGKQFPMEMHIVNFNDKYDTEAAAQEQEHGLAVVSFLIEEVEEDNAAFQLFVDHLGDLQTEGQVVDIPGFALSSILPSDAHQGSAYYRYEGSLTTPPCSETVTWTIFAQTIKIGSNQLAAFRNEVHFESDMYNNFRPTQPLNGRVIRASDKSLVSGKGVRKGLFSKFKSHF